MKNTLKVDHIDRLIVMDRTFAKFATNTMSDEYAHLQQVRRDYPAYTVIRRTIKKNASKNCYHGLTYDYMHYYIASNERLSPKEKDNLSKKLEEKLMISKCQSKAYRYPVIKQWFLDTFPEVREFAGKGIKLEITGNSPALEIHKDETDIKEMAS